ncbi:MAG: hypothetical protein M3Q34_01160 [bacterium]|nr:hypothetical protein [bacterium]
MQNNNNKKIIGALVLAMFTFAVSPSGAFAGGGFYMLESEDPRTIAPTIVTPPPAKAPPTVVTKAPSQKKVAVATVNTKGATVVGETGAVAGASNNANNNLSANASSSGISFMPDTLLEWIFLFILILLGVKLWRSSTITEKEKNAPLKHA